MRSTVALAIVAGCTFQHGRPPSSDDTPLDDGGATIDTDGRLGDAKLDAQPDARVCPPMAGCTTFQCTSSSSCYYYCTTKTSWMMAQNSCDNVPNGCLVTINDQPEHDCIVANVMPAFANFPWIGFRQSMTGTEPAGGWSFVCGNSAFPPNWNTGEPNNVGDEDCAGMSEGGVWFDTGCAEMGRYVCEVP